MLNVWSSAGGAVSRGCETLGGGAGGGGRSIGWSSGALDPQFFPLALLPVRLKVNSFFPVLLPL